MATRFCTLANPGCTAPAGWGTGAGVFANVKGGARFTCYVCGEPVCGECSRLTIWYSRRVRACENCISREEEASV